jgi:hypothetical protein
MYICFIIICQKSTYFIKISRPRTRLLHVRKKEKKKTAKEVIALLTATSRYSSLPCLPLLLTLFPRK